MSIDEAATQRNHTRLNDAIGDVLPVIVDRAPVFCVWAADISTHLAYLRGLEQVMWDMIDNPEWLHELLAFMRDGILTAHAGGRGRGRLAPLRPPEPGHALRDGTPRPQRRPRARHAKRPLVLLRGAGAGARLAPDARRVHAPVPAPHHGEFGLVAYGCCEDLTREDRHAPPDPQPAPHRRRAAGQRGAAAPSRSEPTTCCRGARIPPTWSAAASTPTTSARPCVRRFANARAATWTSRSRTSRPSRATQNASSSGRESPSKWRSSSRRNRATAQSA